MDQQNTNTSQAAPSTPPAPQPPQPSGSYSPQPKKSNAKIFIIVGSIVGGVLLLGVIGLVLWLVLRISPEDYKALNEKANNINDTYVAMSDDYEAYVKLLSESTASKPRFDEAKNELDTSIDEYKKSVDELKGMKALNDSDIQARYDELLSAQKVELGTVGAVLSQHDIFVSAAETCDASQASGLSDSGLEKIGDTYDRLLGPCIEDVEKLSKANNKSIAEYGAHVLDLYEKQQTLMHDLQDAIVAKNRSKANEALEAIQDQADDFSNTSVVNDLQDGLTDQPLEETVEGFVEITAQKAEM